MALDFYAVLGASPDADADELRAAFRARAQALHPDLHPGDAGADAAMRELNAVWHVLGNADRRARYDEFRSNGRTVADDEDVAGPWADQSGGAQRSFASRFRVPFAAILLVVLFLILVITAYGGPAQPLR